MALERRQKVSTLAMLKIVGGIIGAIIGAAGGFMTGAKAIPKVQKAWAEMWSLFSELNDDDDE